MLSSGGAGEGTGNQQDIKTTGGRAGNKDRAAEGAERFREEDKKVAVNTNTHGQVMLAVFYVFCCFSGTCW